jgi:hypothetical protein
MGNFGVSSGLQKYNPFCMHFCGKISQDTGMVESSVFFFFLTGLCPENRIEVKNLTNIDPFFVHVSLKRPQKLSIFSQNVPQF